MREVVALRNRLQYHHQQLFSPPLPEVKVYTSREAAASFSTKESHGESKENDPVCRTVNYRGLANIHGETEMLVGINEPCPIKFVHKTVSETHQRNMV